MAIEKTPSKNWELTLYELQRTPQPLITDDSEIAICPLRLSNELKCPICLDFLSNTMATKECLHRFCAQCIVTALRSGNKECPACRKKLVSKRSLRHDHNFDAIIAKLFPYRKEYEAHQSRVMAKQIQNSMKANSKTNEIKSEKEKDMDDDDEEEEERMSYSSKYRTSIRHSLGNESGDRDIQHKTDEPTVKRARQSSSESGGRETNCSSSITSDLCSLAATATVTGSTMASSTTAAGISTESCATSIAPTPIVTMDERMLDVVLEPLDVRRSVKNRLNETFLLQLPLSATVGHLAAFLALKRSLLHIRSRKTNLEFDMGIKEDSPFELYIGLTTTAPSFGTDVESNRKHQSSSSGWSNTATNSNSTWKRLDSEEMLSRVVETAWQGTGTMSNSSSGCILRPVAVNLAGTDRRRRQLHISSAITSAATAAAGGTSNKGPGNKKNGSCNNEFSVFYYQQVQLLHHDGPASSSATWLNTAAAIADDRRSCSTGSSSREGTQPPTQQLT